MAAKKEEKDNKLLYLLAYVFTWLGGLIVYLVAGKEDPEAKFHGLQAIFLGIAISVLAMLIITSPIALLLWIYGVYVGYVAYSKGERMMIPVIGEFAKKYAE